MTSFNSKEYLRELSDELIINFDRASQATTPGLKGAARESEVRRKLENALPPGVGVGTGCVIDFNGNASRQQDIILYEKNICPRFAINENPDISYFPCEGVIAVGEVKSSFGKGEIIDSFSKLESVKLLRRLAVKRKSSLVEEYRVNFRHYLTMTPWEGTEQEQFDQEKNSYDQIYGFILCGRFSVQNKTITSHVQSQIRSQHNNTLPNMLVSLHDGLLVPFNSATGHLCTSVAEGTGYVFGQSQTGNFQYLLAKLFQVIRMGRTVECQSFEHYLIHEPGKMSLAIDHVVER